MVLGIKNKLMTSREDVMLDVGARRFVYQWVDASDGVTPLPWRRRLYTFVRTWRY